MLSENGEQARFLAIPGFWRLLKTRLSGRRYRRGITDGEET